VYEQETKGTSPDSEIRVSHEEKPTPMRAVEGEDGETEMTGDTDVSGVGARKPFAYALIIVFSVLSFILGTKWVLYALIFYGVYIIFRRLYRYIRH